MKPLFFRTPFFLPWLYPQLLWRMPVTGKKIFLTFDDGPVPGPTEFVLDTLLLFKAKATFFCIGENVSRHPAVFARVIDEGHRIGNHTFHHVKGWQSAVGMYVDEVKQCEVQMHKGGLSKSSGLFRPPYGQISRKQIQALRDYRIVMWDVLTHDYDAPLQEQFCLEKSIRATRPGSIIVFHDSLRAEKNLRYILPRLLDYFSGSGYTFDLL
jgi:peptidoglycan-N-acetylglucosamine deacetylase